MAFEIVPDPDRPEGGWALLRLPPGLSGDGPIELRRLYDGAYLGPDGWQSEPATLPPLPKRVDGDRAALSLGPAIVERFNAWEQLEVRLENGTSGVTVWPEEVLPPPRAAARGGLSGAAPAAGAQSVVSDTRAAEARPAPEPEPEAAPEKPEPEPPAEPETEQSPSSPKARRRSPVLLALLLLVLLAAGAGAAWWWFSTQPGSPAAGQPVAVELPCTRDGFAGADARPVEDRLEQVRRCGSDDATLQEARLAAVEALRAEDPRALVVMGRWYDPAHFESAASPFDEPRPATAADYYRQALDDGVEEAGPLLDAVCERLDPDDMFQSNAREQFCP
jgi:hypothetical protein